MTQRLPSPHRFIYVIGPETGYQKVGIGTDPRSRLAALQTASPAKLRIHTSIAVPFGAAHDVERRAHLLLRPARAAGEWFNVPPARAVGAVRTAAAAVGLACDSPPALPLFDFRDAMSGSALDRRPSSPSRIGKSFGRLWKAARMSLASNFASAAENAPGVRLKEP